MTGTRALVLLGGLGLGLAGALLTPGCLLPDYCIVVQVPGTDWCV